MGFNHNKDPNTAGSSVVLLECGKFAVYPIRLNCRAIFHFIVMCVVNKKYRDLTSVLKA